MAKEIDPIDALMEVEDEELRGKVKDDAELNVDPPEDEPEKDEKVDKEEKTEDKRERNEDGTFKGSEKEPKKAEKEEKKPETVPLSKYLEEKNQLKADLAQRDITLAEFQKKIAELEARMAPKKEEQAPQEPDFLADPKAYVDHKAQEAIAKIEQANKAAQEAREKVEKETAQTREQLELQTFFQRLQAHEAEFVKATPDYHDALAHVRQLRARQLKMFQPDITDQQIMQVITQEETQLAVNLAQRGIDPVKTAYELAQNYGYQKKAPKVTTQQQPRNDQLPPDQTLGASGGAAPDLEETDAEPDPFDLAWASLANAGKRGA